ncbi:MAG: hypothetical protein ACJ8FY_11455 [Gemmataceae bacterium]
MEDFVQLLAAILPTALVPLLGYAIVRLARRWPRATLALLLAVVAGAAGALGYAWHDGFSVPPDTRKMAFQSDVGRWCFRLGGVGVTLGLPALPLVAVARERKGADIGPVGAQWAAVLFGYFMACAICGMVLYSLLTGIIK